MIRARDLALAGAVTIGVIVFLASTRPILLWIYVPTCCLSYFAGLVVLASRAETARETSEQLDPDIDDVDQGQAWPASATPPPVTPPADPPAEPTSAPMCESCRCRPAVRVVLASGRPVAVCQPCTPGSDVEQGGPGGPAPAPSTVVVSR